MAGGNYTSPSQPMGEKLLNGGLNSTAGALELQNNESSDLQNIDFDKFGSVYKRSGYTVLCTGGTTGVAGCDGLWWYEYNAVGTATRKAVNVTDGALYKMDSLDGTWDNITGGLTLTPGNHCDFANAFNIMYGTNGEDAPFQWAGTGTATTMAVPTGLTAAKYTTLFNNYLFLGNVTVSATTYPTRIYWSTIRDAGVWEGDQWIEVGMNDGQAITGLKVLQDRLVVYKERSIYNVFYTGDADIPFILPGGGKANSPVGCIAPFSIQEVENGHVFLAHDGLYYYDGSNSTKLSYKIFKTFKDDMNNNVFNKAVSCVLKSKNRYMLALTASGGATNNRVIVWDYYNNAFSVYKGISASAMTTFFVSGFQENTYFSDYLGYTYTMDTGADDYPANVQTAIDGYYYTNWKTFDDLCDQKGIPHVYIYYQSSNSVLTFAYTYDFQAADQYSQTFTLSTGTAQYGSAVWDTDVYSGSGGATTRRDLTGRGRVVRFKFANNTIGETFQIDGFGSFAHAETNV
jgi:hypothetical protein